MSNSKADATYHPLTKPVPAYECTRCGEVVTIADVAAHLTAHAYEDDRPSCGYDVGDTPDVCRCLLLPGHAGLHACRHKGDRTP